MKIALVYDLRKEYLEMGFGEEETAEFDSEDTVNSLQEAISSLGHEAVRVGHIYELTRCLSLGQRWDLVFNIAEGLYGRSREAQVPALLEAFNIPYTFSDPLTMALSLDKAMTKMVMRDAGVPTPAFAVISSADELERFEKGPGQKMPYPLFTKPVSEGTGKGITPDSIVVDSRGLKDQCRKLLAKYSQPVLVETYLPGREFTVGVLGTGADARAAGVLEVELLKSAEPNVYSYMNKELCEERVKYTLLKSRKMVKALSDLAVKAYNTLGCRDAGRVDFKEGPDGEFCFLEINPLAGLNPTHSDLPILCAQAGMKYSELIGGIIHSALKRRGLWRGGRTGLSAAR
ncbi:MAG: hypothetical protein M0Z59_05845 [Nitrospiraceae bacterium]|nr:hypothetical protein [Nitrospiraceae bacterium]